MNRVNRPRITPILTIILGLILISFAIFIGFSGDDRSPLPTSTIPQSSQDVPRISLNEAKDAYDTGEGLFVDVRDVESYNSAHIAGAILIPISELESRLDELPIDKLIIPY